MLGSGPAAGRVAFLLYALSAMRNVGKEFRIEPRPTSGWIKQGFAFFSEF